jgi:tetratricopeptide (TPR) repeat protein
MTAFTSQEKDKQKQEPNPHSMHFSIAEAGKLFALKGNHKEALAKYREALKLAVSSRAPEVFFRHYTQCVLESLELTGAYNDIIEYCINADAHYATLNLNSTIHRRDHGSILERLGLVYLKAGDIESGRYALERAQAIAGEGVLPISEEVLKWLERGFSVDTGRILGSQRKHHYFVVRKDQVNNKNAKPISTMGNTQPVTPSGITGK